MMVEGEIHRKGNENERLGYSKSGLDSNFQASELKRKLLSVANFIQVTNCILYKCLYTFFSFLLIVFYIYKWRIGLWMNNIYNTAMGLGPGGSKIHKRFGGQSEHN